LWVYLSIPVTLFAIYQVPARYFDLPFAWLKIRMGNEDITQIALQFEGFFRATSWFSEPSSLASYCILTLIFLIVPFFLYNVRIVNNRFVYFLALFGAVISLFLTFSLTAVLQLIVFSAALVVLSRRKKSWINLGIIVVIILSIMIATDRVVESYAGVSVVELYGQRVASVLPGSVTTPEVIGESYGVRSTAMKNGIMLYQQNPFFGTGIGCFKHVKISGEDTILYANQGYIDAFAALGTVGGVALLLFNLFLLYGSVRLFIAHFKRTDTPSVPSLLLAMIPFLSAYCASIAISVDTLIMIHYWILLGLILLVYYHPAYGTQHSKWNIVFSGKYIQEKLRGTTRGSNSNGGHYGAPA
jgi:hypothetical protein